MNHSDQAKRQAIETLALLIEIRLSMDGFSSKDAHNIARRIAPSMLIIFLDMFNAMPEENNQPASMIQDPNLN